MFALHPPLEKDTFFIASLKLCDTLLMNNALFPWIILVPRIEGASEIIDLSEADRVSLMDEISNVSYVLQENFRPKKLNVAALGNQVPQLHVHVIARFIEDAAWPNPVWGSGAEAYDADAAAERCKILQSCLMRG